MRHPLTVLKFGGSVLRDESDLASAVAETRRWLSRGEKVIAVVSAFEGTTDRLIDEARSLAPRGDGDPAALAMLLATGEFATAAKLTLALGAAGIAGRLLGPGAIALRAGGDGAGAVTDADPAAVDHRAVARALLEADALVIPGFIATDAAGQLVLLGRGGSDLTAIFLAHHLQPDFAGVRCRLIKDVDGVYDADPNLPNSDARRYLALHYDEALRLEGGIVQHKAVRFARGLRAAFEVGAWGRDDVTAVGDHPSVLETAPSCGLTASVPRGILAS